MASKTKTVSLHDLLGTLLLVLLLPFWLQNQNSKFLCLDKAFVPCSFTWCMAIKLGTGVFWNLLTKIGVYLFLFMVLISKGEVSRTQQDVMFVPIALFIGIKFINYKNSIDKIAGKYPGWELET